MRLQILVTGTIVAIAVATGVGSATVRAERTTSAAIRVTAAGEMNADRFRGSPWGTDSA